MTETNTEEVKVSATSVEEDEVNRLLEEATAKINGLNELVTILRNENDSLKGEMKSLKIEIDNYKVTIDAMKKFSDKHESETNDLSKEIAELRKINEKLESEIEVIKSLDWKDRIFHWGDIVKSI